MDFINALMPNFERLSGELLECIGQTFTMLAVSGSIAWVLGVAVGVLLTVCRPGGILENRWLFTIFDRGIDIIRSIPFIILIVLLIPVSRFLVGTGSGVTGSFVALVAGTVPFFARQIESVLADIDHGLIEASQAMGFSPREIIFSVYLRESIPGITRVTMITFVSLVGITAIAGAIGAGGLGDFAIRYGYQMGYRDMIWLTVIIILLIISVFQFFGNIIIKKSTHYYQRETKMAGFQSRFGKVTAALAAAGIVAVALTGCGDDKKEASADGFTVVKVGVVGDYNAQWDTVNNLLKKDKIQVKLVKFSDYATPNRALADGEIDLNAFQHKAYLKNDIERNGYKIEAIGDTLITPLRVFNNKNKLKSMKDVKDGDIFAIPSDLTNGGRALKVLEAAGLIVCDPAKGYVPTKTDITKYNVKIQIREAESGVLFNILPDVSAALINGGNAYTAGLDSKKDSIFAEDIDPKTNPNVGQLFNVIVARSKDKDNPVYKKVVDAYHTPETAKTLVDVYKGAFTPVWAGSEKYTY